ncbi:MAG: hypothetical protein CMN75_04820 [Spirochaeta sp.]|nr:hypothetical protein [Spirochaeta sp.]RPG13368.1 MAG: helix-turn-helix domain-containing protein [Proteobacteria bacterium TMED72]
MSIRTKVCRNSRYSIGYWTFLGTISPPASSNMKTQGRRKTIMSRTSVRRLKKKLPERIAEIRGERSQRQFARELGVFQQNVNRYENGTTPHTDFLLTLATEENVSLDWLLLGRGRMRRSR